MYSGQARIGRNQGNKLQLRRKQRRAYDEVSPRPPLDITKTEFEFDRQTDS